MRTILFFATLLLANSLYAQQVTTEASTRYAMSRLVNPEQIGNLLLVDANSTREMTPVGIIKVNKEATKVSVSAFRMVNGEWDLIAARELVPLVFAIERAGNWMVAVRGENVTGEPFFNLVVGPPVQPPPVVDPPPIPTPGDFAQLAAKSKALAAAMNDLPTSKLIADGLDDVLARPPPTDVIAARNAVSKAIETALLSRSAESRRTKNWQDGWRMPIALDLAAMADANRFVTTAEYFRAIKAISESLR